MVITNKKSNTVEPPIKDTPIKDTIEINSEQILKDKV